MSEARITERTMEQLKRGNLSPYAAVLKDRLEAANRNLHGACGLQEVGRVQGRAGALQEILDELERAGVKP